MTPDNKIITDMLHLPLDKTHMERLVTSLKKHKAEYDTTELSMTYMIRSARIQICIYMSSSTSPRGMAWGHFMPSTQDG